LPFAALPPLTKRNAAQATQERGAAIVIVISLILVLTLVGSNMLQTSSYNYQITTTHLRITQASQVAKSALHAISNHFSIRGNELITAMMSQTGATSPTNPCEEAQTTCFYGDRMLPRVGAELDTKFTGGFALDAFAPLKAALSLTATPSVRPNFIVRVSNPTRTRFAQYTPGNSLEQPNVCNYTVAITSTGMINAYDVSVIPPRITTMAERTYRAQMHIVVVGEQLCK
jgi:hypothetical protein